MKELINILSEVDLFKGLLETLYMIVVSTIIAYIIGFPLGVFTLLTDKDGLLENKIIHKILNIIINVGRSIPFIILIIIIMPFTNLLVGKGWGPTATIVSLSVAATFFVGRIVEQSLSEVGKGIIESSVCMGATIPKIIFKVYLGEALPSIIKGISITMINIVGYSAMAGAVGGGGLGDIAIKYGYYNYRTDVMIITLVVIILLVQVIQILFDFISKKIDRRR